jgi:hypothetical protein
MRPDRWALAYLVAVGLVPEAAASSLNTKGMHDRE